jgi:hypothetical protein
LKLLQGKTHLNGEYYWIRAVHSPHKICQGYIDVKHIVAAVAGTRPMVLGNTIYGSIPGKAGVFSFFTRREGVEELARLTDGIHYYWERERTKKSYDDPYYVMPSTSEKPRATLEEPWHDWNNEIIANKIIQICEDSICTNDRLDEICFRNGLSHFGFDRLFQQRWPLEYYEFKKNKTIPTKDQLALTHAQRMGAVPCTN